MQQLSIINSKLIKFAYQNASYLVLILKMDRTVKGINFENIRDAGDPVELAKFYSQQGADELVFLDITATIEKRKTLLNL